MSALEQQKEEMARLLADKGNELKEMMERITQV